VTGSGDNPFGRDLAAARALLGELGLAELPSAVRPVSGHKSSLPIPCVGRDGRPFLLKYFIAPGDSRFYPREIRLEDYARRESAFYRLLDTLDPDRRRLPAPRTILLDPRDPPRWLLLERILPAPGPMAEVLGLDHVFRLLETMRWIRPEVLLGRRDFPVNRWDVVSYLDRVRMMYDDLLPVLGERHWPRVLSVLTEALKWTEARPHAFVHGDFTEDNIVVDGADHPFLVDFERVGAGNPDHDIAWFWAHTSRGEAWRTRLLERYLAERVGSTRIASEWAMRATLVYLALRRLRFEHLAGSSDPKRRAGHLDLLDRSLEGGSALFPG
jgi:hypothetical protein